MSNLSAHSTADHNLLMYLLSVRLRAFLNVILMPFWWKGPRSGFLTFSFHYIIVQEPLCIKFWQEYLLGSSFWQLSFWSNFTNLGWQVHVDWCIGSLEAVNLLYANTELTSSAERNELAAIASVGTWVMLVAEEVRNWSLMMGCEVCGSFSC